MKTKIAVICGLSMAAITACNYSEREQKLRDLSLRDPLLMQQANIKDSSISTYLNTMTVIQDNLDSLAKREKIITVNSSEHIGNNIRGY